MIMGYVYGLSSNLLWDGVQCCVYCYYFLFQGLTTFPPPETAENVYWLHEFVRAPVLNDSGMNIINVGYTRGV